MDYEKAETAAFKCVVDTLNLRVSEDGQFGLPQTSLSKAIQDELADVEHADKPFGALFNVNPPPPEYDQQGNVTNAPVPHTLSPAQLEASTKRSYQPLDRVNASIGFSTHETERNFIFLRVAIPFDQIPDTIDPRSYTADGFIVKLKFYANNMIRLDSYLSSPEEDEKPNNIFTSDAVKLFSINDEDKEVFNDVNIEQIPKIVLKTPGYDRVGKNGEPKAKFGVFRLELNIKDIASAVSENLMHSTTWPAAPWAPRRVIKFLQFIMSQHTFSLPIYVMDSKDCDLKHSFIKCLRGMQKELRDGNPFRGYLSQNFAINFHTPTIDSGASIKDSRSRPNIVTQKQLQYCTKEEMITRLAVATKQQLEDRRAKIIEFCALKQTIRLMKIVDDSTYYAFFMAPQELRLQPGDILKVNFRPDNPIRNEDWNLVVCEPFDWSYQGESVGVLKRPLVPLPEGATEEEKRAFRPLVRTALPAVNGTMDSPDSCRALLESDRPVSVILNYYESETAEARVFKALNHFLHSTYPNFRKLDFQSPNNFKSESMEAWSKVLLMHDNRVRSHVNILGDDAGLIMERFNDKDQLDAIEYLKKTPVNSEGKAVGIIEGFPGVGKTAFLAHVVVCMLAQRPQAPICCICAASQPTDVLAKAIERAIENTRHRQPDLSPFLRQQVVIRAYPTATETNFLIGLADRAPNVSIDQTANVVSTIPPQTGTKEFMCQFRQLHALLIRDASLATLVDLVMLFSSFETDRLILFGDTKQLTPQTPFLQGSQGLTREKSQNVMSYFMDNHWPKAQLYIQRRGCPEIMEVASELFYRKRIQDALVHRSSFHSPYLYINAVHEGEIMDHSTKSWMNLTSAAVNINLIEYLVTKCDVSPSSMIVITHYTAQLRVYTNAISKLASDYPMFAFSEVAVHTMDSIKDGSADITLCDSVRTQNTGFTNNPGRNCVALTRARSFGIVTANTQQLNSGGRNTPVICKAFDIARKAKACVNISKSMNERYSNLLLHRHVQGFA
ncbi:uncharacterized protein EAE97_001589 [Botrytis byssoidea]|uniref:DNA2/NAM7 helicase-like C-terminal domain-containing protein n=1 Tax=Botrytis byssoidea TaxID=139641 RepID=A0A9P5IY51_9HELO|nr:uncharacterized protein EAE97_001589 [Botrytis byssoidea]KAF7952092.1 hypothetical protein EAE97_001589 [Botrytis byssoidea]